MSLQQESIPRPLEVARSAGVESAHAPGQKRLGAIRPGMLADLLVVDSNPLADFKAL